jgi:hypothetical protein
MGDIFEAIGFKLQDEADYQRLAETVCQKGIPSLISRRGAILRGYCWALNGGIEIWTILHESKKGTYFADCRPAFRSQRICEVTSWEVIEFIEDGEVLVSGSIQKLKLIFQLQNFTDLSESVYQLSSFTTNLAGLCYRAKIFHSPLTPQITSRSLSHPTPTGTKYYENDYLVTGKVVGWQELNNPITNEAFFRLDVKIGEFQLELLVGKKQCKGTILDNAWISAEVWLQGHIVHQKEQQAKYEGLDVSIPSAEHWSVLKREN